MKLSDSFRALTHKNYRIFWFGQLLSLIGTWMQSISQPWLAYTLTKSPFLLGVVGALQFTPTLLFSLFMGSLLDRFNKRRLILGTQVALALIALLYAALVISGHINYWQILILATVQGTVGAIDMPARQAFMIELVGKEDLPNAIALNSTIFNAARIVGPALAGLVMVHWGIGFCFLSNALSFIPVIWGLLLITPLALPKREKKGNLFKETADGLRYIRNNETLFRTILSIFVVSTFIMNFNILIPVLAKTVLGKGEAGFSFLMSCMGIGSLTGALTIAITSRNSPRKKILLGASLGVSLLFILIGLNHSFILSAILVAMAGFLAVSFLTSANALIQTTANDEFRTRVISTYFLVNAGTVPIGNLVVGTLTDLFGVRICLILIGSLVFILVCLLNFFFAQSKASDELETPLSTSP